MAMQILSYLPGYYECECGAKYISDVPFKKACCLNCYADMEVEEITQEQIDGFLYNLGILEDSNPRKIFTLESIAEFTHYEDTEKVYVLMKFLMDKGYISFKREEDIISNLTIFGHYIRIDYSAYSKEQRLELALNLAKELVKKYSRERYTILLDICKDDIFYCDGTENDFYIEDERFIYKED